MRNSNRRGGAAVVAVLVIIMLVAVSSAVMVVTGRKSIQANKNMEVSMPDGYDTEVPESSETDSSEPEEELSSVEIVPEEHKSVLPQIADSYHTIDLEDATFNSAVLMNCDTNEIIAGYKYDKKVYPASLTKLMTILVAAENIGDMDATYTFTDEDIDPLIEENASRAGFEAGEEVTMEDLFYAAISVSGADGTLGLAKAAAGSEEEFVKLMNDKVTEMGLSNTKFVNPSGLHSKEHYTTVQDIAAITKACYDNEICRKILSAESYTTSKTKQHEDGIVLDSIFFGRFGGYWIDVDGDGEQDADLLGGKTGFTDEAMYTLSTLVEKDDTVYVCVVTKCDGDLIATEDTIAVCEAYLPGGSKAKEKEPEESKTSEDDTSSSKDSAAEDVEA